MSTLKRQRPVGRPTDYTPEIAALICERVAQGEPLNAIYSEPNMPKRATVYGWIRKYPEFAAMYARAQEDRADYFADEIVAVADDSRLAPDDRRVRVDARKWVAAKLRPRRYGERVELSGDPERPVVPGRIEVVIVDPVSTADPAGASD